MDKSKPKRKSKKVQKKVAKKQPAKNTQLDQLKRHISDLENRLIRLGQTPLKSYATQSDNSAQVIATNLTSQAENARRQEENRALTQQVKDTKEGVQNQIKTELGKTEQKFTKFLTDKGVFNSSEHVRMFSSPAQDHSSSIKKALATPRTPARELIKQTIVLPYNAPEEKAPEQSLALAKKRYSKFSIAPNDDDDVLEGNFELDEEEQPEEKSHSDGFEVYGQEIIPHEPANTPPPTPQITPNTSRRLSTKVVNFTMNNSDDDDEEY